MRIPIVGLGLGVCFAVLSCSGRSASDSADEAPLYEMCSWPEAEGGWNFRVMEGSPDFGWVPDAIFDTKFILHGIDQLKRKISELPPGSEVNWFDHTVQDHMTGTEALVYPPDDLIDEIVSYAGKRGIKIRPLR